MVGSSTSRRAARKPRERGITHVLDRGLSVARGRRAGRGRRRRRRHRQARLGHGARHRQPRRPSSSATARHGIPVVLGGTLTELAIREGRVDGLVAWLRELGLEHVEISDGTIALEPRATSCDADPRLAGEGFTVFSEVGSKDAEEIMAPYRWVEQIEAELEAGAWKVDRRGARDRARPGIYRPDGEVRMGLIDEIAHAIDIDRAAVRGAAQGPAGVVPAPLRPRGQPRQHRPRRRAVARDAAARAALGHRWSATSMILLARHGETAYNAERRFQGQRAVPLNDTRPRAGARAGRARRRQRECAALWCSPLRPRAARRRDRRRGDRPRADRHDARFAETDCGDWTDRMFDDVDRRGSRAASRGFASRPTSDFRFPGGESFAEQQERVDGRRSRTSARRRRCRRSSSATAARCGWSLAARCAATTAVARSDVPNGVAGGALAREPARRGRLRAARRSRRSARSSSPSGSSTTPPAVQSFHARRPSSRPTATGASTTSASRFAVKKADDVTVDIVDHGGDVVRTLVANRHVAAYRKFAPLRWDGRDRRRQARAGRHLPRARDPAQPGPLGDRAQVVRARHDAAAAARCRTSDAGQAGARGAAGGNAGTVIDAFAPGHHRVITIYRTDVDPAIVVRTIAIPDGAAATLKVPWDGRDAQGRPRAGRRLPGRHPGPRPGRQPRRRAGAAPRRPAGQSLRPAPGGPRRHHGLATCRSRRRSGPGQAGQATRFFVAAAGPRRIAGRCAGCGLDQPLRSGGGRGVALTIPAPRGSSGVYLLEVHSNRTTLRVPFAVNGQPSVAGRPTRRAACSSCCRRSRGRATTRSTTTATASRHARPRRRGRPAARRSPATGCRSTSPTARPTR